MRVVFDRFVIEVDPVGREEDEDEDKRHHDVIVKRASFVGPPEVAANCPPHRVHGGGWRVGSGESRFGSGQVYWLAPLIGNISHHSSIQLARTVILRTSSV